MGKILVVGGGVAGIQSSLDLARTGHQVYLVEKKKQLGGNLLNLNRVFPSDENADSVVATLIEELKSQSNITIHVNSALKQIQKGTETFEATVEVGGKESTLQVDAVVVATGLLPYDPTEKSEYGYSKFVNVITSLDLEKMMKQGKLEKPSDSKRPQSITFVQCVGFRDVKANKYCSCFCCTSTVKNALLIKKSHPDTEITVMYMDIRTPNLYENLYSEARENGVRFIRARPAEIFEKKDKLAINFEDTLTDKVSSLESDLVVLATGGTPPPETKLLSQRLNLSVDEAGFIEVSDNLTKTTSNRVFVVGAACGPRDIDWSLSQAGAAASQINKLLRKTHVQRK